MLAILSTVQSIHSSTGITTNLSSLQRTSVEKALRKQCHAHSQERSSAQMGVLAANAIWGYLTEENRSALRRFVHSASPYLLLKGAFHTADLPPTPSDDTPPPEAGWRTQAAALLGYLKLCGSNALSFEDEMGGRLFHMVMPAQNDAKSMLRSTKALNFHTEVVNGKFREEAPRVGLPIAPEKFALGCLRNPNSVPTITDMPLES